MDRERALVHDKFLCINTEGGIYRKLGFLLSWKSTPATFDYGWDNTACGILTLFEEYGAREFVPYLRMLDPIIYPTRGLGLTRTQTLAEGICCDFKEKPGEK